MAETRQPDSLPAHHPEIPRGAIIGGITGGIFGAIGGGILGNLMGGLGAN